MSYRIDDETRLHLAPTGDAYRLTFFQESDPFEPWDDCGAVPLVAYRGRDGLDLEPAKGFDLLDPFACMTDSKIKAKLPEIFEAFRDRDSYFRKCFDTLAEFESMLRAEYDGLTIREARREWLAETLGDGDNGENRLRLLADLWQLAGVPAAVHISRGYSQGDWAALLIVAHPDAVAAWGFTRKDGKPDLARYRKTCPDDLETAARNWSAWCWGGVIGYKVARVERAQLDAFEGFKPSASDLNQLAGCAHVDSCWGFYPEHDSDYFPLDRNHAYAIGQAVEAADADAVERAAERAEVYAAEMLEARPDLAPIWEGAQA